MDFCHAEDREKLRAAWNTALSTRADFALSVRTQDNQSPSRLLQLKATPLPSSDGAISGFAVTLEEESELEQSDAELLHSSKMEAVGRLASGLAHDFSNLLTMISGYSEIVLGRMGPHEPLRSEVDEIRKAANRGSALTGQLLLFSRRPTVEPQVLDLNALVADLQKMLRRMLGELIDIAMYPSPNLGRVKADAGQIEQVIMNLAINARDAMPRGGKISIRTANVELDSKHERVTADLPPGPYVMLQVSDTGDGMDGDTLQHLFEPFFTTKEKVRVPGWDSRRFTQSSDRGTETYPYKASAVKARRSPSTCLASMRRASRRPERLPRGARVAEPRRYCWWRMKTACDACSRTSLRRAVTPSWKLAVGLRRWRFTSNRVAGLVLLTDIVMPHLSGRELAERLLKLQPDLKIIYMSGYTDEVMRGIGPHSGALFLQKPLRPDVLVGVCEVLDGPARPGDHAANCVQSGT